MVVLVILEIGYKNGADYFLNKFLLIGNLSMKCIYCHFKENYCVLRINLMLTKIVHAFRKYSTLKIIAMHNCIIQLSKMLVAKQLNDNLVFSRTHKYAYYLKTMINLEFVNFDWAKNITDLLMVWLQIGFQIRAHISFKIMFLTWS